MSKEKTSAPANKPRFFKIKQSHIEQFFKNYPALAKFPALICEILQPIERSEEEKVQTSDPQVMRLTARNRLRDFMQHQMSIPQKPSEKLLNLVKNEATNAASKEKSQPLLDFNSLINLANHLNEFPFVKTAFEGLFLQRQPERILALAAEQYTEASKENIETAKNLVLLDQSTQAFIHQLITALCPKTLSQIQEFYKVLQNSTNWFATSLEKQIERNIKIRQLFVDIDPILNQLPDPCGHIIKKSLSQLVPMNDLKLLFTQAKQQYLREDLGVVVLSKEEYTKRQANLNGDFPILKGQFEPKYDFQNPEENFMGDFGRKTYVNGQTIEAKNYMDALNCVQKIIPTANKDNLKYVSQYLTSEAFLPAAQEFLNKNEGLSLSNVGDSKDLKLTTFRNIIPSEDKDENITVLTGETYKVREIESEELLNVNAHMLNFFTINLNGTLITLKYQILSGFLARQFTEKDFSLDQISPKEQEKQEKLVGHLEQYIQNKQIQSPEVSPISLISDLWRYVAENRMLPPESMEKAPTPIPHQNKKPLSPSRLLFRT
jgi:hypothetical protein